ncbi:MAG: glycosyltransferase family 9 protein, partial [Actinomycetes bacterium]
DWSLHEVDRALQVANAAGFVKPVRDSGGLAVRRPLPPVGNLVPRKPYVVLHPGTSVPARAWPAEKFGVTAKLLRARGTEVVVTGSEDERAITTSVVAGSDAVDLTGRTDLPHLASVLAGAEAVVVANTGPAHLAAAVGTPVVSLFAPTVSAQSWQPYGVPSVVLGEQTASCRGTRARVCPVPGHPCLGQVDPKLVLVAIEQVAGARTDSRWGGRETA